MNFKIGQKVVCVNAVGELIKGKTYIVDQLHECSGCGIPEISVGLILKPPYFNWCGKCGHREVETGDIKWHRSDRFRPINHDTCHDEILEEFKAPNEEIDVPEKELA